MLTKGIKTTILTVVVKWLMYIMFVLSSYSLMTICWADHADQRPGFSHIVETLERFIATRRGYLQLDELESEEIIVEQLTEQTSDDIDSGE